MHVKYGISDESVEPLSEIRRRAVMTGTHYSGRGAEVCPLTALDIFTCGTDCQMGHPAPGEG